MKPFSEIRSAIHSRCSDFAAGLVSLAAFELETGELLRRRAGCCTVTLWRQAGPLDLRVLRCFAQLTAGGTALPCPLPLANADLSAYLLQLDADGCVTSQSASVEVAAEAHLLHCIAPSSFLHIPTYYNGVFRGVVCFSDATRRVWSGPARRELKQLIALITTYVSPLDTGNSRTAGLHERGRSRGDGVEETV